MKYRIKQLKIDIQPFGQEEICRLDYNYSSLDGSNDIIVGKQVDILKCSSKETLILFVEP